MDILLANVSRKLISLMMRLKQIQIYLIGLNQDNNILSERTLPQTKIILVSSHASVALPG